VNLTGRRDDYILLEMATWRGLIGCEKRIPYSPRRSAEEAGSKGPLLRAATPPHEDYLFFFWRQSYCRQLEPSEFEE
jgi:hypothetical protein